MSYAALESKFRMLAEARQERDMKKKAAEKAEAAYRELEAEIIEEITESNLKGSIKFDFGDLGIIQFTPKKTTYGRIIDKAAAIDSFNREARTEEMFGDKIESARLNEYVKDHLENKRELPPGVGFYEKRYIQISHKAS